MAQVFMLCAQLAGGWTCLPTATVADCLAVQALMHPGVTLASQCQPPIEQRTGSKWAPDMTPLPVPRP